MKKWLTAILGALVLLTYSSQICTADETMQPNPAASAGDGPPDKPHYLTGNEEVWRNFPAKPALGSPVDQTDLLITLSLQAGRTEDQKNEAFRNKSYSIKLVTDVIDPSFEKTYPDIFKVLTNADVDSYYINSMIKNQNGRLRPYVQHPTLVVPLFTVSDFSYPSGHATGTELQARILGLLFPKQSDALLNRARQVADSRVVAGVHYASDTEAGINLGDLIFTQIASKREFQKDLAAAVARDPLPAR
jgi:acid phosphatase (class A)